MREKHGEFEKGAMRKWILSRLLLVPRFTSLCAPTYPSNICSVHITPQTYSVGVGSIAHVLSQVDAARISFPHLLQ